MALLERRSSAMTPAAFRSGRRLIGCGSRTIAPVRPCSAWTCRRQFAGGLPLLGATYGPDGTPVADYEATSMYATTLAGFLVGPNPTLAHTAFATKILHDFQVDRNGAYWGDPTNYYDQNWAWFATALMDGGLANLWRDQRVIPWDQALP